MFFERRKVTNDLTRLIENNSQLTVREVLEHTSLSNTVLNESPDLLNFILPAPRKGIDHLDEFIDWALTSKNYTTGDDFRLMHNAGRIFTSPWKELHRRLQEDGRLCNRFNQFCTTKFADDPLIAGNFNTMVMNHIRMTEGTFLDGRKYFHRELFKRLHITAYKDLVSSMLSEYGSQWGAQFSGGVDSVIFLLLSVIEQSLNVTPQTDKEKRAIFNVFSIITDVQQSGAEARAMFLNPDIIDTILTLALLCRDTLNMNKAFHVLRTLLRPINELPRKIRTVVETYGRAFKFGNNERSRAAFPVFYKAGLKPMMKCFFSKEYPLFNAAYVESIGLLNEQELEDLLKDNQLIEMLIEEFSGDKVPTNGCVIELVNKLISPELPLKVHRPSERHWKMNSEAWYSVVYKVLDLQAQLEKMKDDEEEDEA